MEFGYPDRRKEAMSGMSGQWIFDETHWDGSGEPAVDPHWFMASNSIDTGTFREALVEYRNLDTGYYGSPWEQDELGVLSTDFVNWYRWERL
jgi:hypothetical protein